MNKNNVLALLGIFPAWIALLVTGDKEVLILVILAVVLVIMLWLGFSAVRDVLAIRKHKEIFDELRVKYEALIQRVESVFSRSHTHSVFYVWNSFSDVENSCRMDNSHHQAIHAWIIDVTKDSPRLIGFASKMRGLSVAVAESTHLAEKAHRDLQELSENKEFSEMKRKRLKQEWATARDEYNDWLRECSKFFKEVNTRLDGSGCYENFRFVNTLE